MSVRTFSPDYGATLGYLGNGESITPSEVESELSNRGYTIAVHEVHHVVPTPEKPLTKAQAISIAVDMGLDGFNLPRTNTHPRMCSTGTCPVDANVWQALVNWCVTAAQGYLVGRYRLPDWWVAMQTAGLGYYGGLGGVMDWLEENPLVISLIGGALTAWGTQLSIKNVKDTIQQNVPKELLKKEDMASFAAYLQSQGYVPEGKAAVVASGAQQAATPSWIMPAAIVGGALLVIMMMRK